MVCPLRPLLAFAALVAISVSVAGAAEPSLVVDLAPGLEAYDPSEDPDAFFNYTPVNGRVVFLTRQSGRFEIQCGLWVTDGTPGSTRRLAEFCGEARRIYDSRARILASTGAVAFLTDFFGKLWRTDGTPAGTFPLADVTFANYPYNSSSFVLDGRTLLFQGCTPAAGCELWRSDGTREGTKLVADLRPGSEGAHPDRFTLHGRRALFATYIPTSSGFSGGDLWATDGTSAGTVKLFSPGGGISQILLDGTSIYLTALTRDSREVVWALSADAAKAVRLASFYADRRSGVTLIGAVGRVLMKATDHHEPVAFWITDGTRAGTRPVVPRSQLRQMSFDVLAIVGTRTLLTVTTAAGADRQSLWFLDPGMRRPRRLAGCPGDCPRLSNNSAFVLFQGRLFFAGWDPAHGFELWSTDGTAAGTRLVTDTCPGACDGQPLGFRAAQGRLFFPDLKRDLWMTDATEAGTVRVASLPYGVADLAELGGRIVFTGLDAVNGPQPWVSDLTPGGTGLIDRIGGNLAQDGRIQGITALGGKVLFTGCDGTESAVWASDGTAAGTVLLPGTQTPCLPSPWVAFNRLGNFAFFSFPFSATGSGRLWRTDGSATGTMDLLDLSSSHVLSAGPVRGGKLLFRRDPVPPPQPYEPLWDLWTSDGTPGGTQRAFRLRLAGEGYRFVPAGDEILFSAQDPEPPFAYSLWITDGTEAGTRRLLKLDSGGGTLAAIRLGTRTFFVVAATGRNTGYELWSTDGTAAGTVPVFPGENTPRPVFDPVSLSLVVFKDELYFFAAASDSGQQGLWRSDGTAAGTRLVCAVDPPSGEYDGNRYFLSPLLTPVGDLLFFRADDRVHGAELWKTDGTPEGTLLVKDVAPGPRHANPAALAAGGGKLYFTANDGEHGFELWESDGTATGTRLISDLWAGSPSSGPEQLVEAGGRLFFTADDGEHGRELWMLPLQ